MTQVNYGEDVEPNKLIEISKQIKTFTEGTDPASSNIVNIKNSISTAEKLVFLGYGFHQLNMELITPSPIAPQTPKNFIIGTTKGISKADTDLVKFDLKKISNLGGDFDKPFLMGNYTCSDLFKEYWRYLAF